MTARYLQWIADLARCFGRRLAPGARLYSSTARRFENFVEEVLAGELCVRHWLAFGKPTIPRAYMTGQVRTARCPRERAGSSSFFNAARMVHAS